MTEFQFHILEWVFTLLGAYTAGLIATLFWLENKFKKTHDLIHRLANEQSDRTLRLEYWAIQQKGEPKFQPGIPVPHERRRTG